MLKWTKKTESKSMSGAAKSRAIAPPAPSNRTMESKINSSNNSNNTSANSNKGGNLATTRKERPPNGSAGPPPTLSYPTEVSDDVNMNEVDGLVTLDVTLPSGQRADIAVDYNTPMLDLLICLAGKSRLNPSGLALQLLSEHSAKPMTFTSNQTIGSLGGRVVRIVTKDVKNKHAKNQQPFEMTHRFIINLPRGQKAVVRVSPLTKLGDLVASVCQEKDFDLRRHILQIPGQPGVGVDLNSTIQQVGVHELNLITVSLQERSYTMSLPDLSQPPPTDSRLPSYMPSSGEAKKKRGFLSFLSKKDKKFKPHDYSAETSSTTSKSSVQVRKATTPPSQRRGSDSAPDLLRPKSMFVGGAQMKDMENSSRTLPRDNVQPAMPVKKKRRAPAPPVPSGTEPHAKQTPLSSVEINIAQDSNSQPATTHNASSEASWSTATSSSAGHREDTTIGSSQPVSRAEMLSRLHSRNSSDSSGYHELTLSGCESPEAAHHQTTKSKISIDTTSIESADNANGDSGVHESPSRVSPIEEVQEKAESNSVSSTPSRSSSSVQPQKPAKENIGVTKKRKKAPAPPTLSANNSTTTSTTTTTITTVSIETETNSSPSVEEDSVTKLTASNSVQISTEPKPVEPSEPNLSSLPQPAQPTSLQEHSHSSTVAEVESAHVEKFPEMSMQSDPHLSDEGEELNDSAAFDINDILEGVVFDQEPQSMELRVAPGFGVIEGQNRDQMMMMETASVTSENIEQVDQTVRSERPCSFIPPPPPTEPPPPEEPVVDINTLTHNRSPPMLVDRGTELNDDNTSLAPSSAKSSPGTAESGYKNEMALFVERMSKMAVEEREGELLDDSISSLSMLGSDTNSDTGSVIQHQRTNSKDSKSGSDSGSYSRQVGKKALGINATGLLTSVGDPVLEADGAADDFAVSEEISAPVETVPPPPEFDDSGSRKEDEEEEEYFTETIEELIIPLGPNGYDFSAAKKRPDLETPRSEDSVSPRDSDKSNSSGMFRAEPVAVNSVISQQQQAVSQPPKPTPKEPREKEEFVLTTEDLSSVTFLPPKPKAAKRPDEVKPSVHVSTTSLVMARKSPKSKVPWSSEDEEFADIQHRVSQISFRPATETENHSILEEKPITLLNMPAMRPSSSMDPVPAFSDDSRSDSSYDHLVGQTAPHLVMNSNSNSISSDSRKSSLDQREEVKVSVTEYRKDSQDINGQFDEMDLQSSGSRESVLSAGITDQYAALQAQFAQWQEQLDSNQKLLAKQGVGSEMPADQIQLLSQQMVTQQHMMQQLQSTMQALQQSQTGVLGLQSHQLPHTNGVQEQRSSPLTLSKDTVPEPIASQSAAPPPPPPPPPPSSSVDQQSLKPKFEVVKSKPRPRPKFERELDPREELMIAIRNFNGRGGLRSVPVAKTKWVHSNRL